jgi:hypothetical protein
VNLQYVVNAAYEIRHHEVKKGSKDPKHHQYRGDRRLIAAIKPQAKAVSGFEIQNNGFAVDDSMRTSFWGFNKCHI